MYEVICGEREVGGVAVETFKRDIYDANVLEVEAGTNGYKGGVSATAAELTSASRIWAEQTSRSGSHTTAAAVKTAS